MLISKKDKESALLASVCFFALAVVLAAGALITLFGV
jgi:hypothetical protein